MFALFKSRTERWSTACASPPPASLRSSYAWRWSQSYPSSSPVRAQLIPTLLLFKKVFFCFQVLSVTNGSSRRQLRRGPPLRRRRRPDRTPPPSRPPLPPPLPPPPLLSRRARSSRWAGDSTPGSGRTTGTPRLGTEVPTPQTVPKNAGKIIDGTLIRETVSLLQQILDCRATINNLQSCDDFFMKKISKRI